MKDGLLLDFEQATTHAVRVRVTDPQGWQYEERFDIAVTNKSPEIIVGDARANKFIGGTAADTINGGSGNDTIYGGTGNDKLLGGAGIDALYGDVGNDILTGGANRDVMTGGAGLDDFNFDSVAEIGKGSTRDVIKDFVHGQDDIDLSTIDANGALAGNTAFVFIATKGAAFTGSAGAVRWYQSAGHTYVEGDVNGDRVADFQIDLAKLVSLTAVDFIL